MTTHALLNSFQPIKNRGSFLVGRTAVKGGWLYEYSNNSTGSSPIVHFIPDASLVTHLDEESLERGLNQYREGNELMKAFNTQYGK